MPKPNEVTLNGIVWYAKGWLHALSATQSPHEVGIYLFEAKAEAVLTCINKLDSGGELTDDEMKALGIAATNLLNHAGREVSRKMAYRGN